MNVLFLWTCHWMSTVVVAVESSNEALFPNAIVSSYITAVSLFLRLQPFKICLRFDCGGHRNWFHMQCWEMLTKRSSGWTNGLDCVSTAAEVVFQRFPVWMNDGQGSLVNFSHRKTKWPWSRWRCLSLVHLTVVLGAKCLEVKRPWACKLNLSYLTKSS